MTHSLHTLCSPYLSLTAARGAGRTGERAWASSSACARVRTGGRGPVRTEGGTDGAGGPAMGRLSTCAAAGVADMATSAAAMAAANMGCMNEELLTNQGRARAQPGEASVVRRLEVGMYWNAPVEQGLRRFVPAQRSEEHPSELQSLM